MDTNENITSDIRYRSPSFTPEEMLSLIDCCEHYKLILFNKTTTGVVNKAKDAAWKRITKAYNQCGHRVRDLDILRNKWDNMKRLGKKVYRASLDNQDDYKDDLVTKRMAEMILEADKYPQHDLLEDNADAFGSDIFIKGELKTKWNNENGKEFIEDEDNLTDLNGDDHDIDDSSIAEIRQRSSNFSPRETILLLKCVKAERKIILNKGTGNKANTEKILAWDRITELFNKQNSIPRSLKVLQTKFSNMRRSKKLRSSKSIQKGMKRKANSEIKVELEPVCNLNLKDNLNVHEDNSLGDRQRNKVIISNSDPLNTFLNGTTINADSGEYYNDDFIQTDNQDFNALRMELLKYQMETAKLERERAMEALAIEKARKESQSLENALRVRTARLEAVAAESKLPLGHPALDFTPAENSRICTMVVLNGAKKDRNEVPIEVTQ